MKFITLFITFAVFYYMFDWIVKKTDIHNKLFNKSRMKKYIRIILIFGLVLFALSIEYGKQLLKDTYGHYNYISMIVGAFMSSIYMNFVPLMFKRNK